MYKLQKIRSRKIIHNVSFGYRQKLNHTILTSRKEIINTVQISSNSNKRKHVEDNINDSINSTIQKPQNQNIQNIFIAPFLIIIV